MLLRLLLLVCILLPATAAAATLRGEYRFEDMPWTGAAGEVRDSSGNNRHGQALGTPLPTTEATAPARSGVPGTCSYGSFAGGALNLAVAANTTPGAKTTVSFWMYWNGTNSVMPIGWSRHDLWLVSGHFGFNTGNSDVFGISSAGLANRWVHVVAEFTNGSVATNTLYIDGVAQTLTQRQGAPNLASAVVHANLRVGGWQTDGNYRFRTRIDEVKVFDGVLTAPEVTALFNETHACAPRLVQEWRFDECALGLLAGEVVDASGNGNHGTPQGAANTGAGRVCKAGIFNGVSPTRIKATTLFADGIVNDFTLAFWVNPTATHQLDAQSASGTAGTGGQRYVVYPAQGTDAWGAGHAGAGVSVGTNGISVYEHAASYMPPLLVWSGAVSGWTHVAVVYQSRQPRLYVNGALVATGLTSTYANVHPGLRTSGGTPTNDGGLGGGNWGWFIGGIDEFRVYDGALDAAGVASIAAAPARACATCATLAKYRLEEGSWSGAAGEVQDASGNARHGRALGAPIPITATVSPARTGDPGTCGYGGFAGGALNLPVAASTAAGAKTTVSFWMYWNGTNSVMPIGWSRHDLWLVSGHFGFNTGNSDVFGISSAGLANRWVHVVAEFTNGSVATNTLYIDGVAQTLTQRQGTPNLANAVVNATLRASGWQADSGYRFRTRLDEIEVFDGEMSLSQVLARYNETHPCGVTPSVPPSGFNAFETTTAGISGWIRTKVAASAFALDVVALNTAATAVETTFTGAVGVELVNAAGGGACGGYPLIRSLGTLTFAAGDQGRKTLAGISEPEAWPNARIRMRYPATGAPTVIACSTDNFAIRPANFGSVVASDADSVSAGTARTLSNTAATGGVVHKAGQPFRIAATALNAAGVATANYTGTPVTALTACVLPGSGCTLGALTPGTWSTAAGITATLEARYSEVGAFAMKLTDTSFAAVDAADGSSATEMTIESAAVNIGRFVPNHFVLTPASAPVFMTFNDPACAARSFTYAGQPFGYLTVPQATIAAKNAAGATTLNYAGPLWKLAPAGSVQVHTPVTGVLDIGLLGAPTVTASGSGMGVLTANAADEIAFVRATPVLPFLADISLSMSIQDIAEAGVSGNGTIDTLTPAVFSSIAFDAGNEIRFGQLVLSNAHGSELLGLPVPIEARFWNGSGFILGTPLTADSCTQLAAANVVLSNWQRDLDACDTSASLSGRFNAGRGNLRFSAPGVGNTGSVDLTLQLGVVAGGSTCVGGAATAAAAASQTWLQGRSSTGVYNQNPTARASFGLHRGNKPLIYLREMY